MRLINLLVGCYGTGPFYRTVSNIKHTQIFWQYFLNSNYLNQRTNPIPQRSTEKQEASQQILPPLNPFFTYTSLECFYIESQNDIVFRTATSVELSHFTSSQILKSDRSCETSIVVVGQGPGVSLKTRLVL